MPDNQYIKVLSMFPPPFTHDFPSIPWLAQDSFDGSRENSITQLQEADVIPENLAELLPSLNTGLSLIWLPGINLINAYDNKELILFSNKIAPEIHFLSLKSLNVF